MLCNTTVKPSGYKEEEIIALPASYRSYYYNLIDLVGEIHELDLKEPSFRILENIDEFKS